MICSPGSHFSVSSSTPGFTAPPTMYALWRSLSQLHMFSWVLSYSYLPLERERKPFRVYYHSHSLTAHVQVTSGLLLCFHSSTAPSTRIPYHKIYQMSSSNMVAIVWIHCSDQAEAWSWTLYSAATCGNLNTNTNLQEHNLGQNLEASLQLLPSCPQTSSAVKIITFPLKELYNPSQLHILN